MYRFGTKMNREDVIALRWPKACLSCGSDIASNVDARYAILGMFHDTKDTQILLKLAGFFYICDVCNAEFGQAQSHQSSRVRQLAASLIERPWTEFIILEKDGVIVIPQGIFYDKLKEMNPDLVAKHHVSPMNRLRSLIEKET